MHYSIDSNNNNNHTNRQDKTKQNKTREDIDIHECFVNRLLSVLRFTASDYPIGYFKPFLW